MASQFPTAQKFSEQLKKKNDEEEKRMKTLSWRDLTVNGIYRIDSMKEIADCGQPGRNRCRFNDKSVGYVTHHQGVTG